MKVWGNIGPTVQPMVFHCSSVQQKSPLSATTQMLKKRAAAATFSKWKPRETELASLICIYIYICSYVLLDLHASNAWRKVLEDIMYIIYIYILLLPAKRPYTHTHL